MPKNTESENVKIKKIVYGSPEYKQSLNFRNEIFRKPQGMDIKDDDLEYEKEAEENEKCKDCNSYEKWEK